MREALTGMAQRRLTAVAEARLAEEPVLVLNGPRTVGKSTPLSQLAGRLGCPVLDCDDPVLIDEYQHVPELLDAIKAQLNRDLRPGRYVLAGSTRYATFPEAGQALTGRVDVVPVLPLSQGEIGQMHETFVTRLLAGAGVKKDAPPSLTSRDEYAHRATSGGMPVALRCPPGRSRSRWFSNYVNLVIDKDVLDISKVWQREMLPRLLEQLAARSAQVLNMAAISGTIG